MKVMTIETTAFWCMPTRPNNYGNITMDAGFLSDEDVAAIKAAGGKVSYDKENEGTPDFKGWFIKPKATAPLVIKGMDNEPLPENLIIGNGSKMVIAIGIKPWTYGQKSGYKLLWLGGKLKELVPYDPDAAAKAKADALLDGVSGEGFTFGENTDATGNPEQAEIDKLFADADEQ